MNDKKTYIAVSNGAQPISLFEDQKIRIAWDAEQEEWYFSIVDVIAVLTDQLNYDQARNYWKVLKSRLAKGGSQLVTACNQLKMRSSKDGKNYSPDVTDTTRLPDHPKKKGGMEDG